MRIRWTETAASDLTSICDYINEHDGPEAARRVALRIYEGVGSLTQFPRRGRPGRKPNPFIGFIVQTAIRLRVLSLISQSFV